MIGKDQNIASLGTAMEKVATTIANVVIGLSSILGRIISIGSAIFSKLKLDKVIAFVYNNSLIAKLASFGASEATKPKSNFSYSLGSSAGADIARATENKRIKDANKLRAAENAALKAKTELDKLKDKFDVERIGLTLALNQATDEETKLRLKAQLAILDNNEALAKKLNAELGAKASIDALATAAGTAANALTNFGPALFNALGQMTARGRNQIAPDEFARLPQGATNQQAVAAATNQQTTATVVVNAGAIVTDQQLEAVIQQNVLQLLKSGNKLLPAGSLN